MIILFKFLEYLISMIFMEGKFFRCPLLPLYFPKEVEIPCRRRTSTKRARKNYRETEVKVEVEIERRRKKKRERERERKRESEI